MGDSDFINCLFSYLENHGLKAKNIKKIRGTVYLLTLKNRQVLILKGFADQETLHRQQKMTFLLNRNGFTHTYKIFTEIPPFSYNGRLFSLIEYIQPHKDTFHFFHDGNRKDGLRLLSQFHHASKKILAELSGKVPSFNQIQRWEERLEKFNSILPLVSFYVSDFILTEYKAWASWSLNGMKFFEHSLLNEENTIIHGDVAHHNFLRRSDGTLCLIDFDLMAVGRAAFDYLQFANRILPSVNYDADALWRYPELKQYQTNPAFLYALTYPTDIFREWNRLVKENGIEKHAVWKLTVQDFNARMVFNREIARTIGMLH
ncbi:phosphotransferase [Bacillus sp. V59.32b]|uniref:phosphotransferase n=1 Tax=Bacillus sp. V59.32b TaxID=1758642 RepID=UPI000E3C8952|nr:phosphotransferase [Bacillus sp. V59.32b]RFU62781.1 hypothetical protein D0463_12925 [Bacillus sp. V59.32b]